VRYRNEFGEGHKCRETLTGSGQKNEFAGSDAILQATQVKVLPMEHLVTIEATVTKRIGNKSFGELTGK